MAQTIQCDSHNLEHLADWLVTNLENGDSQAYCNVAYRDLMVETVDAMNKAEADQADAEAVARVEAAGPAPAQATAEGEPADNGPGPLAVSAQDRPGVEAALDRIEHELAEGLIGQGMDRETAEAYARSRRPPLVLADDAPQPSRRVKRGQSAKARKHRERVAARAAGNLPTVRAGNGGDDDEDDDEAGEDDRDGGPA